MAGPTDKQWLNDLLEHREAAERAIGAPLGKILGCGHFGCAFASTEPWAVKLTVDPNEAPMWAFIGETLALDPTGQAAAGFTRVKDIVHLLPGAGRGQRKKPLYAIVREQIHPVFENNPPNHLTDYTVRRLELDPQDKSITAALILNDTPDLERLLGELIEVRGIGVAEAERIVGQLRDFWNALRATHIYDDAVERHHLRKLSRKKMLSEVGRALGMVEGEVGAGLRDGLGLMLDHGVLFEDLHIQNIGWRTHALIEGYGTLPQGLVIFDPGRTPTPYKPKIGQRQIANAPAWTIPNPVFR